MILLAMALCGGMGAVVRFMVDAGIRSRQRRDFPFGTLAINLCGSALLGVLTGLVACHGFNADWQLVLGTGFCGGFTTFSTASVETVRLWRAKRPIAGLANTVAGAVGCVCCAALGFWLI